MSKKDVMSISKNVADYILSSTISSSDRTKIAQNQKIDYSIIAHGEKINENFGLINCKRMFRSKKQPEYNYF